MIWICPVSRNLHQNFKVNQHFYNEESMPPEEYISDTEDDPYDCNQFKGQ